MNNIDEIKIEDGWEVWERNFYGAKKFFTSKGNIKTKARLKAKWLKQFQEDLEEVFKLAKELKDG